MAVYKRDIVDINLETGNIHRSFLKHSIGMKDQKADHFGVRVFRNGEAVSLTGVSVQGVFMPPQGSPIAITSGNIVSGNVAEVVLPQACYNYDGQFTLAIKLVDASNSVTGTVRIVDGMVDNTHASGTVAPTSAVPTYQEVLSAYEQAIAVIGNSVRFDQSQSLTDTQKGTARTNIAAASESELSDVKSALDDTVDCVQHNLMPYACNKSSTNAGFTVTQNGNETTLSGTSTATAGQSSTKILLTDHIQIWDSTTVPDAAKVYPINLISGHSYKLKATIVSGTRNKGEGTGDLIFRLIDSSGNKINFTVAIDSTTGEGTFVSSGENVQIRMLVSRLMTVTSLVVRIELEDITEEVAISGKQNTLTFDDYPVEDSTNPVKSGGLYDELEEIRDCIGYKETTVTPSSDTGYYWNSQTSTAVKTSVPTYQAYDPLSVEKGEKYKVTIRQATSDKQYPVLLVDDDYTIVEHYGDRSGTYATLYFTIPDGVTKVLLTCQKSYIANIYKLTLRDVDIAGHAGMFDFKDKNIAIIGDSISTNGDYSASNVFGNVPEIIITDEDIGVELSAYATFYDIGTTVGGHTITADDVGTEITFTPVSGDEGKMVGKPKNNNAASVVTWWEVAMDVLGFNPIPVCWSGSSITSHEADIYDDDDHGYIYKTSYAWHPAQIRKCGVRTPGSMDRTAPDMVIIYRGTNDFSHAPITRLTDYLSQYPFSIPANDIVQIEGQDKYGYLEGYAITINKIHEAYPEAKIVLCTFNYFHRMSSQLPGFPSRNSLNTIYQYNDAIRALANYFGCGVIEFDKDGITYANAASGEYYQEGTSPNANHTHPTTKGHKVMGNRALLDLMKENDMT